MQIWGPTRVEHHLLADMIRMGGKNESIESCCQDQVGKLTMFSVALPGGQVLSQESQPDEDVRLSRFRFFRLPADKHVQGGLSRSVESMLADSC